MPSPVETLLTAIGVPAEDVAKVTATPADATDFDAKPFVEKVKTNFKTQFQNDPSFYNDATVEKLPGEVVKKIETAQYLRAANIMKTRVMKGLGLTDADLSDMTDEQKEKLESFVQFSAEKFVKTKASDKQVQAELIEAKKQIEKFGELETTLKTKYQGEADQKILSAIFNASLLGELSSIPGLKVAASDIARTASEILNSKYGFEKVGDFAIELRQKANPALKVLKENSSQELTLKDALLAIATERGWISEEDEDDEEKQQQGSGKVKIKPGAGKLKMVAPHLQDKISKKIASEQ